VNNYEALYILKSELAEEALKGVIKAIGDLVTKNGGSLIKEEGMGKRSFSYPIKKKREGYYYKLDFTAPGAAIKKLEEAYKLNANILRAMITRR
jgi:small subunit ribosomal protein S6